MSGNDSIEGLWAHVLSGRIVEVVSHKHEKVTFSLIYNSDLATLPAPLFLEDFTPLDNDELHCSTTASDLLLMGYELSPVIAYGMVSPNELKWKTGLKWERMRRDALDVCIQWRITKDPNFKPANH